MGLESADIEPFFGFLKNFEGFWGDLGDFYGNLGGRKTNTHPPEGGSDFGGGIRGYGFNFGLFFFVRIP